MIVEENCDRFRRPLPAHSCRKELPNTVLQSVQIWKYNGTWEVEFQIRKYCAMTLCFKPEVTRGSKINTCLGWRFNHKTKIQSYTNTNRARNPSRRSIVSITSLLVQFRKTLVFSWILWWHICLMTTDSFLWVDFLLVWMAINCNPSRVTEYIHVNRVFVWLFLCFKCSQY